MLHASLSRYNILAQETDDELCRQFNSPRDRFTNKIYFKCLVAHARGIFVVYNSNTHIYRYIYLHLSVKILNAQLCDLLGYHPCIIYVYIQNQHDVYNKSLSPTKQLLVVCCSRPCMYSLHTHTHMYDSV